MATEILQELRLTKGGMKLVKESLLLHLKKAQSGNIGLFQKDLDEPKGGDTC